MRTDMCVPLWQLFKDLGKPVDKSNVAKWATFACQNHGIFMMAAAPRMLDVLCCRDMAELWAHTNGVTFFDPMYRYALTIVYKYNRETFTDQANTQAIFDHLTETRDKLAAVLKEHGVT